MSPRFWNRCTYTPIDDSYVSILSCHLHSTVSIIYLGWFGHFYLNNATSHTPRVVIQCIQEHFSDIRYFIGHLMFQFWTMLNIYYCLAMSFLEEFATTSHFYKFVNCPKEFILWISSFRHSSNACHVILRYFCSLLVVIHGIKKLHQFFWMFGVVKIV